MSLWESETVEYSLSPDELMLKELERRDGIYSFIFHELETTNATEGGSYLIDNTTTTVGHKTNGFNHNQFIIYKVNEMEAEAKIKPADAFKKEVSTSSPFITSSAIACASSGDHAIKNDSSAEFWKTSHPPYATCTSLNTPPSGRFLDESKLYNYVATGSFCVRIATRPFSQNSVPLVRNRRHALKETPDYQSFINRSMGHSPDLRSLFPLDPDAHAPFAQMSVASDATAVGENEKT